ncbi:ribosomal protein L27 [Plantactinospora soyae]|uniref:Ribosomal protein L27 n=1 Tax=Plantactinospora soyae TaxID=1544732 RepID=A0A927R4F9_9ACTN|nr:ribosomal protein L27 [Plantactinospora soyae]
MYLLMRLPVTARLLTLSALTAGTVAVSGALFVGVAAAAPTDPIGDIDPYASMVTEASSQLMEDLLALQPGSQNGGIYANKDGYHNTRAGNDTDDYSVRDVEDKGGPADKAAAYDWTFPEARGSSPNYSNIARYSNRLLASTRDPNDPRLDGWREFFGQADNDGDVEGWDFRYGRAASSDNTHLWHIHLSEDRDKVTRFDNKEALLSVLRGETTREWRNKPVSPILGYDSGASTVLYRWGSTGSSFSGLSTATHSSFDLDNVGDRFASGDVNADGKDDTVMAHQNPDTSFTFKVFLNGTSTPQNWYTSGPMNLTPVGNRLIVGDFNGDRKHEPILAYDSGTATILYRWYSTGASFSNLSTATYSSFDLDNVGTRIAAGDVNADGKDDTVMAYQNTDTSFTYKVFRSGTIAPENWYTSGPMNLTPVGNRLIVGDFNGDRKHEPILAYDSGTATILYRWYSTGASFSNLSTATYSSFDLDNVGTRIAAGDVNADGKDDTVMAYQNTDTSFTYKVFRSGTIAPENWYTSGPMNLTPVGDRLILGAWL